MSQPRRAVRLLAVLSSPLSAAGCDDGAPLDAGPGDAGLVDAGPVVIVLPDDREPCADHNALRNPYFGDLHVHTQISFDANRYGTRARPRDVYRFARGEPLGLPPFDADGNTSRTLQLSRPLDFAAVTDHAEFFGHVDI